MKRPPPVIKKELVGLRRTLRGAEKRYEKAELDLRELKRSPNRFAAIDAESALHRIAAEIEQLKRAIRAAEEELVGDWRPKAWGSLSDVE